MSSLAARLVGAFLLLALASAAHAQTPATVKFSLGWIMQGQHAPFLHAQAMGYFKDEGLDVTIDTGNGSAGTIGRVATGAYDMGFADLSSMIEFLGNNPGAPRLQYAVWWTTRDEIATWYLANHASHIA